MIQKLRDFWWCRQWKYLSCLKKKDTFLRGKSLAFHRKILLNQYSLGIVCARAWVMHKVVPWWFMQLFRVIYSRMFVHWESLAQRGSDGGADRKSSLTPAVWVGTGHLCWIGKGLGLRVCTRAGILLLHSPTGLDLWKNLSGGWAIPNCSFLESLLSSGSNMQGW